MFVPEIADLHMSSLLLQPNLFLSHGSRAIQLSVFGTHTSLFPGNWELSGSHFGPQFIGGFNHSDFPSWLQFKSVTFFEKFHNKNIAPLGLLFGQEK